MPDKNTVYVSFSAEVNPTTCESLLKFAAQCATNKIDEVILLLSTPGGSVMCGINVYNVLRSMPFDLTAYNVGSVNSAGNVIFLAAEKRYAVPHSTFLFHGVGFDVKAPERFEEKRLRERLDGLLADQKKLAAIITERTHLNEKEAQALFRQAKTRDLDYAKDVGVIHDIREVKIPSGAPVQQFVFKR